MLLKFPDKENYAVGCFVFLKKNLTIIILTTIYKKIKKVMSLLSNSRVF